MNFFLTSPYHEFESLEPDQPPMTTAEMLHIVKNNALLLQDGYRKITRITAVEYQVKDGDNILICDTTKLSKDMVIKLPVCQQGKTFLFKKSGGSSNKVKIVCSSNQTIDGDSTHELIIDNSYVRIISYDNWYIIGGN